VLETSFEYGDPNYGIFIANAAVGKCNDLELDLFKWRLLTTPANLKHGN